MTQPTQLDLIQQGVTANAAQLATLTARINTLITAVAAVSSKETAIMSEQDQINQAAQQVETDVAAINDGVTRAQTEIANLEAQIAAGQAPDLTALKQAVADIGTATGGVGKLAPPPPAVTGVSPNAAPAGATVAVTGSGFTGATAVTFGTIAAASFTVTDDSDLQAVVPSGVAGQAVPVVVTTPYGSSPGDAAAGFTGQ